MTQQAKQIRVAARLSQTAAAALAHVAPNSWRLFEANADAVNAETRARCEAALARMATSNAA